MFTIVKLHVCKGYHINKQCGHIQEYENSNNHLATEIIPVSCLAHGLSEVARVDMNKYNINVA